MRFDSFNSRLITTSISISFVTTRPSRVQAAAATATQLEQFYPRALPSTALVVSAVLLLVPRGWRGDSLSLR